ncbi:hypothetical protein [Paenibacillus hamazuiensis]|uniref:hypothetical protein n=1 Tax=Paenibacillus hamazuiensis TaxID=2936508 RepID=UPI00200DE931|nr:hypothetical protein [Paenibacillus hamazuiensis]
MNALPLPKRFDANEWFIIGGLIVGFVMVFPLRKKFPPSIGILLLFVGLTFAKVMDVIVGFQPFNLYDLNDSPQLEVTDVFLHFVYAPFGFVFIYLYERWRIRGISVIFYMLLYSLLGIGIEWIGVQMGVYHYKGWHLGYSYIVYLYMQCILLLFYRLLVAQYRKTKRPNR